MPERAGISSDLLEMPTPRPSPACCWDDKGSGEVAHREEFSPFSHPHLTRSFHQAQPILTHTSSMLICAY